MRSTRRVSYRVIYEYAMLNERLSYEKVATHFNVSGRTVRTAMRECCTDTEYENRTVNGKKYGKRKPIDGVWRTNGYLRTITPDWFKGGCERGTSFVHHLVWCADHSLSKVPAGLEIHHIDGDKLNNNPANLWAMTPTVHRKLHALERKLTVRR
ncbi:HNH endonuclease [Plectonema phage JingP1]|uniref:HNH endonuclease n=1 Tax=Plectonema phage JingP1 TaxID=2961687 RepID=A0A9E7NNE0_9CAUD|nr:HNH endonuclease [Plectonema phage JingP1]